MAAGVGFILRLFNKRLVFERKVVEERNGAPVKRWDTGME